MTRLASLLQLDVRLQQRYGFYYAATFVSVVWIVLLRQVPDPFLAFLVPLIIFVDLGAIGFFFIAGMVLFEKEERTLSAIVVTPMRFGEYLASKLTTLTLLAVIVSLIVVLATYGTEFNLLLLILGIILTSLIALLVGFISVASFDNISTYLLPSQIYFLPLYLPLIHHTGWIPHPLFYLIPTQGSLVLLKSAFEPVATWHIAYAISYQLVWIAGLAWWAYRRFERHIVARG